MPEKQCFRQVTVINSQGLHARPAHAFVTMASKFQSNIEIVKDGERVDGKSILSILTLAAVQGSHLMLRATGEDADEAIEALATLIEQGFSEGEGEGADEHPRNANGPPLDLPAHDQARPQSPPA